MANITGHKSTIFFNLVLILFFILMVSMVKSRVVGKVPNAKPGPVCDIVVGVNSGDTCLAIAEQFKLTTEAFHFINSNLNCNALFVDQWLCIAVKST